MGPQVDPLSRKYHEDDNSNYPPQPHGDDYLMPSALLSTPIRQEPPPADVGVTKDTVSDAYSFMRQPSRAVSSSSATPTEPTRATSYPFNTPSTWPPRTKPSPVNMDFSKPSLGSITIESFSAPTAAIDDGNQEEHPALPEPDGSHPRRLYIAAATLPVLFLGIAGLAVLFFLRRRKRQRNRAALQRARLAETKKSAFARPQAAVQPYMAPVSATYSHTSRTQGAVQPVILGPIPSGINGAYLTGIDTSDIASMRSGRNTTPAQCNPFTDNHSICEPPPPYRPRSIAPPSFTSTSRPSSMRSGSLPITSRTHLIEHSPFADSAEEDVVSELSGPTADRGDDNLSDVSDLSYQHAPQITRPA